MTIKQKITTFREENGEILGTKIRNMYNPFDPVKGYNFKYKSRSIKNYLDIDLPKEFSDSELGKILRLSRLIYGNSNMLGRRVGNYIKEYTQSDIIKVFGLKDRQGRSLLKKMLDNKIIKPQVDPTEQNKKHVLYFFNPIYFFSGTYLNLNLFLLFQDELNAHLPPAIIEKFLDLEEKRNLEEQGANSKVN